MLLIVTLMAYERHSRGAGDLRNRDTISQVTRASTVCLTTCRGQHKKITKSPITIPWWEKPKCDRRILPTKGHRCGKRFHHMMSSPIDIYLSKLVNMLCILVFVIIFNTYWNIKQLINAQLTSNSTFIFVTTVDTSNISHSHKTLWTSSLLTILRQETSRVPQHICSLEPIRIRCPLSNIQTILFKLSQIHV